MESRSTGRPPAVSSRVRGPACARSLWAVVEEESPPPSIASMARIASIRRLSSSTSSGQSAQTSSGAGSFPCCWSSRQCSRSSLRRSELDMMRRALFQVLGLEDVVKLDERRMPAALHGPDSDAEERGGLGLRQPLVVKQ